MVYVSYGAFDTAATIAAATAFATVAAAAAAVVVSFYIFIGFTATAMPIAYIQTFNCKQNFCSE